MTISTLYLNGLTLTLTEANTTQIVSRIFYLRKNTNQRALETDHMFFEYNYGLYFTLWDRIGGTHRVPSVNLGNGPKDQIKRLKEKQGTSIQEIRRLPIHC